MNRCAQPVPASARSLVKEFPVWIPLGVAPDATVETIASPGTVVTTVAPAGVDVDGWLFKTAV